jgi:hypothetical protein
MTRIEQIPRYYVYLIRFPGLKQLLLRTVTLTLKILVLVNALFDLCNKWFLV